MLGRAMNDLMLKFAWWVIKRAMKTDPSYAWGWHCNLAMMAYDAGAPHDEANARAADFMEIVFDADTRAIYRRYFLADMVADAATEKMA